MYDENDLYNEVSHTVRSAVGTAKTVYDFIEKMNANNQTASDFITGADTSFVFTGQSTDLSYFNKFPQMSVQLIENIPDENLKNAVKQEFNKAALDGKLTIDMKSQTISITEKGRAFINKPEFKQASSLNIAAKISEQNQVMGFELDGTTQDLAYFKFSESLDIKELAKSPDTETVQKILSNFSEMKNSGLISMEGSLVKLTEKGKKTISNEMFALASKGASEKTLATAGGVPGKIFVVTKKLIQSAVQKTANNMP